MFYKSLAEDDRLSLGDTAGVDNYAFLFDPQGQVKKFRKSGCVVLFFRGAL